MTCNFDCFSPVIPLYEDLAQTIYVANGSTTDYQFAFDYLDKATFDGSVSRYVRVWIGNDKDDVSECTDFTMPNSSTVRISPATSANHYILIRRDSKPDETMVDFTDPNVTSADLDLGYKHNLYLVQEIFDKIGDIHCRLLAICGETASEGLGGPSYSFNGDCASTGFVLDSDEYGAQTDLGVEDVLVFINGVLQPPIAYSISNSVVSIVVFDVAPTNTDVIYIKVISNARIAYRVQEAGIADGAITTNKLAAGSVTPSKMGFTGYGTQYQAWMNADGTNWAATTITAAMISGFDTQVRTNRITQLLAPNTNLSMGSNKITNLSNGTVSTDAAAYGQISGMEADITAIENNISGGYSHTYGGVMPDLYYRANYMATRDAAHSFYAGCVPQIATSSTRHATQLLMTGFIPRRIKLLLSGAIRRNASNTTIHSHANITRTFEWYRWDDDGAFTCPNSGAFDGQYKTYTLLPQGTSTGDSSALSNITFTLEIDFTNAKTWLYIYGGGFGSELMRLTSVADGNVVGHIQIVAERGY